LSLFTGNTLGTLALVEANDDEPGRLSSRITRSFTAGTTYQIAVDGYSSGTGPIRLSITPGSTGSPYAAEITETANKEDGVKDPLTGNTIADTFSAPVTDLTMGQEKDLLLDGGSALDAPSLFSPAASDVPILVKDLSPVSTDANGILAGSQPLEKDTEPFGAPKTSLFAEPYLLATQPKQLGL
jgi:hypothetical protein